MVMEANSQSISLQRAQNDLYLLIGLLIAVMGAVTVFSSVVAYDAFPALDAVAVYVGLAAIGGLIFLLASYRIKLITIPTKSERYVLLAVIILAGFVLRGMMFYSVPILEDDWFRYLWDGAVTAIGVNPFAYPPEVAFDIAANGDLAAPSSNPDIEKLRMLSAVNDHYAYEVSYPSLTTIYPIGAQFGFWLAHQIKGFDLNAWRTVLLLFDSLALGIMLALLRTDNRALIWSTLYWLNPLLILEGFNSGHMDVLIVAPLLLAVLAALKQKPTLSGTALGIAVTIKLWPLLLTPLFAKPLLGSSSILNILTSQYRYRLVKLLIRFLLPVLIMSIIAFLTMFLIPGDATSGLGAYTAEWRKNNLLFSIILSIMGWFTNQPDTLSRIFVASAVSGLTLWLSMRTDAAKSLPRNILLVTIALFFLAPAGYPWYAIWFVSFLPLIPNIGLAFLAITLPLYYLRFPLATMNQDSWFNFGIAPIEFALPLVLIFMTRKSLFQPNGRQI